MTFDGEDWQEAIAILVSNSPEVRVVLLKQSDEHVTAAERMASCSFTKDESGKSIGTLTLKLLPIDECFDDLSKQIASIQFGISVQQLADSRTELERSRAMMSAHGYAHTKGTPLDVSIFTEGSSMAVEQLESTTREIFGLKESDSRRPSAIMRIWTRLKIFFAGTESY